MIDYSPAHAATLRKLKPLRAKHSDVVAKHWPKNSGTPKPANASNPIEVVVEPKPTLRLRKQAGSKSTNKVVAEVIYVNNGQKLTLEHFGNENVALIAGRTGVKRFARNREAESRIKDAFAKAGLTNSGALCSLEETGPDGRTRRSRGTDARGGDTCATIKPSIAGQPTPVNRELTYRAAPPPTTRRNRDGPGTRVEG